MFVNLRHFKDLHFKLEVYIHVDWDYNYQLTELDIFQAL